MTREHRPSRRASRVWRRLTQWYGARLAESFGPTCPEDWCDVIDRTDDERLEQALATIRRDHLHHPPTLGEFEAAIPKRQHGEQRSPASLLAEHAVKTLPLCPHQLARPWSYFGPVVEFQARKGRPYSVSHPVPRGVVIPACQACDKPSHRVLLEDVERKEDAA